MSGLSTLDAGHLPDHFGEHHCGSLWNLCTQKLTPPNFSPSFTHHRTWSPKEVRSAQMPATSCTQAFQSCHRDIDSRQASDQFLHPNLCRAQMLDHKSNLTATHHSTVHAFKHHFDAHTHLIRPGASRPKPAHIQHTVFARGRLHPAMTAKSLRAEHWSHPGDIARVSSHHRPCHATLRGCCVRSAKTDVHSTLHPGNWHIGEIASTQHMCTRCHIDQHIKTYPGEDSQPCFRKMHD